MTGKEQESFYIAAALHLDLDSEEVDVVLAEAGLNAQDSPVLECREAIRERYPHRWWNGMVMRGVQWLPPTPPGPCTQK